LTPLNDFSWVNDPAETISAESLTNLKRFQRGHWPLIGPAKIHAIPLKFQIVVLAPQLFLKEEISC
jgi:hypothetical protein